jgi:hypothetical protein
MVKTLTAGLFPRAGCSRFVGQPILWDIELLMYAQKGDSAFQRSVRATITSRISIYTHNEGTNNADNWRIFVSDETHRLGLCHDDDSHPSMDHRFSRIQQQFEARYVDERLTDSVWSAFSKHSLAVDARHRVEVRALPRDQCRFGEDSTSQSSAVYPSEL